MSSEISAEEIHDVLSYIDKIKNYDRKIVHRVTQINNIVWGVLFLYGGLMDLLFSFTNRPEFSALPWMFTSIGGAITTVYISKFQPGEITSTQIKEVSDSFTHMNKLILIFIIGGWMLTPLFVRFNIVEFIIPWVGIMIFLSMLSFDHQQKLTIKKLISPSSGILFVAFLSILSSIINFIGIIVIGFEFIAFQGLLMGTLVGIGFLNFGIRMREN